MPFYHGDRVGVRSSGGDKLKLGRVQEYIEEPVPIVRPPAQSDHHDDSEGDRSFSSPATTITPPAKTMKMIKVIPPHLLDENTVLGITSPLMTMKKSGSEDTGRKILMQRPVKRQVVWDDNKGSKELKWFDDNVCKVMDRKFTIGQRVFRAGLRGKVIEVIPLATVKVCDRGNGMPKAKKSKNPSLDLIPDLSLSDIRPMNPFFNGVNIEYKGWIGQIVEVHRTVTYRLLEPVYEHETYTWTFQDSSVVKRSPGKSAGSKRSIPKLFAYPFKPSGSCVPYKGKVDTLDKSVIKTQFLKMDKNGNKENNNTDDCSSFSSSPINEPTTISPDSPEAKRPSLSLTERRKKRLDHTSGTVESVVVVSINVRWTGRLPMDLIKPSAGEKASWVHPTWVPRASTSSSDGPSLKMPPVLICEKDLKLVRPFYVHPALYFDKIGLCICKNITKGMIVSEKQWVNDVYMSLSCHKDADLAPFDLSSITLSPKPPPNAALRALRKDSDDCSNNTAEKRKRLEPSVDNQRAGRGEDVIVCKHFVRHMYKVIWEPRSLPRKSYFSPEGGDAGLYYGNQLEPDLSQEHKLCLGLIHSHLYVVAKRGTEMDGMCDYGVVIEKPSDDSVVVEWMKICSDGNAVTVRILKCDLVEIDKHPRFNELHEGRIVMRRKEAAKYKLCKEFRFGTVVSVQRFSLGQISVYCPIEERIVSLWPHMLEVYVGMSMQDLIAHNVVGLNKAKLEEPCKDESGNNSVVDAN